MNPERATVKPTLHSIENILARGGTEEWIALYAEAKKRQNIRQQIQKAASRLDPDLDCGAGSLWTDLVENLNLQSLSTVATTQPLQAKTAKGLGK
jgi:hypothetical protein